MFGLCFYNPVVKIVNLTGLSISWLHKDLSKQEVVNWVERLKIRWKVKSAYQVVLILIVFACTGFTVLFIKKPVFELLFGREIIPLWASVVYYLLILPVYNVFLLCYGFIFGQFRFFWDFEKRLINNILSILKKTNH